MRDRVDAHAWIRIKDKVVFVNRVDHDLKANTICIEGYTPQNYAAYIAHWYIGENESPYRTVAEIEHIPSPEPIRITISRWAKFDSLTQEEALKEAA